MLALRPARRLRLSRCILLTAIPAVGLSMTLWSGTADADGGGSIAGAAAVSYGTQEFGNLANGTKTPDSFCDPDYSQYWALEVTAGDRVTIDWEVNPTNDGTHIDVMPVGTTDYNVDSTDAIEQFWPNSNYKAESIFEAPRDGVMPLRFHNKCASQDAVGPYDFTASVRHALAVSLASLSRIPARGVLHVGIHMPDGKAVASGVAATLQARAVGHPWRTIHSVKVTSAPASIAYSMPRDLRGMKLKIRVRVTGAAYQTATSPTRTVQCHR